MALRWWIRPYSENATQFLESRPTATIAVYPTIVRRLDRTAHSFESQKQIIASLAQNNVGSVVAAHRRIDLGEYESGSQQDIFEYDMRSVAEALKSPHTATDYALIMEILPYPGGQRIFGIHVFILDQQGRNAFSFLLNSHHQSFEQAGLSASDSSEDARVSLLERATRLGVTALQAQFDQAHHCATHTEVSSRTPPRSGVVDNFQAGLPSGTDEFGLQTGFVTFSDGSSSVDISATDVYPASLSPHQNVSEAHDHYGNDDNNGCHWSDPALGVSWPFDPTIVSDRAESFGSLADLRSKLGIGALT